MPYYGQHDRFFHSHARARSSSSLNGQNNPTSTVPTNSCKFISCILCRLICCVFLFIIALCLFRLSFFNGPYQRDGSSILAFFLLAISIISCIRSCSTLKGYSSTRHTRHQFIQGLHEVYNQNNDDNPELVTGGITNLPSYKELFPSHLDISSNSNNPLSTFPPPSYDTFMERLVIHHPTTTHPMSSLRSPVLSISTTPFSSTSSSQCMWITDQTQRPVCIPDIVTYL